MAKCQHLGGKCMYTCASWITMVHVKEVRRQLGSSMFSPATKWVLWGTRVRELHIYPLSHLTGPKKSFKEDLLVPQHSGQ